MNATPKILRILHLEDTRSDAEIVRREMKKSEILFEWCLASSKLDFQKALIEYHPDVVISDHSLPGFTSVDAFKMVKEAGIDAPFILVTATVSEEFAVSMIKEGIADYLLKDRLQRLPNAVLRAIDKRKSEREKEQHLSEILQHGVNLSAIMENSDVSIYSLDKNFCYVAFNSLLKNTVKEFYGLDIKIGDNACNFLRKFDYEEACAWENIYKEAFSGKLLKFEKEFRISDIRRYTSFTISPIRQNNCIIGLSCFARDITDQKIAEEELLQSEERYRNIVETAQEGIWIVDDKGLTNFVNKKLCDILQYPAEEMLNKSLFHFMDDEGRKIADQGIKDGKYVVNQTLDFKFINGMGETVWTNLSTSSVTNREENYIGALAMVTDITNKKLYQQSLETSEANIRSIFESAQVAYVLLKLDFSIVSFNQVAVVSYEKQFGRTLTKNSNLLDYYTDDRREAMEDRLRSVLRGRRINYETYYEGNGSGTWYNIQLSPVLGLSEMVLGVVVEVIDITKRKESELQQGKITADLIQRNSDLEQFAYIVSHNFRAPVANILGICSVLNHPNLNADERVEIENGIALSATKLDDVIKDLNNILKVKRELNEKKEEVRFSELVNDVRESISDLITNENVSIKTDFSQFETMLTLKSYMHSVFYNLISNSIKYRRADIRPIIEIRSFEGMNVVGLTFKDNGQGIDLTKHGGKIFGLYKRFHDLQTEGKGMGLFMVKTQVEALGGKVSVNSTTGEGTEFTITFNL